MRKVQGIIVIEYNKIYAEDCSSAGFKIIERFDYSLEYVVKCKVNEMDHQTKGRTRNDN